MDPLNVVLEPPHYKIPSQIQPFCYRVHLSLCFLHTPQRQDTEFVDSTAHVFVERMANHNCSIIIIKYIRCGFDSQLPFSQLVLGSKQGFSLARQTVAPREIFLKPFNSLQLIKAYLETLGSS